MGRAACLLVAGIPWTAAAEGRWASVEDAEIRPGVRTMVDGGGQCTTNFIYTDDSGERVFIGVSAHCVAKEEGERGCETESRELGTEVAIEGASEPGQLAYSSWEAMSRTNEQDETVCQFNDFALIEIDETDHDRVNPTVPFYGGPEGMNTHGTEVYTQVFSYGSSKLRLGIEALSPKHGASLGTESAGWSHAVYTLTPGVPGDSGSAFLDNEGAALGSLSTLALAPLPASNNVTDLRNALTYAREHGAIDVKLVDGTEPFDPPPLPFDPSALPF